MEKPVLVVIKRPNDRLWQEVTADGVVVGTVWHTMTALRSNQWKFRWNGERRPSNSFRSSEELKNYVARTINEKRTKP